jgi:hypothetical protein
VAAAERAVALATAAGSPSAAQIDQRLALYRQGRPFRCQVR